MRSRTSSERSAKPRRKNQRHIDAFSVRLISGDGKSAEICELRNVSTGGMAIAAPQELPAAVGETLLVEFPLGRSSTRLQTRCTVRGQSEAGQPILHLQFLDQSVIFVATVQECIESWESREQLDRRGSARD